MPGEDYYTDFHKGDPYVKVDQGFARLPGAGYAALHPELEDVNPEDYPDIHKMAILADVAPYSREYNTFRLKVGNQARDNTELQIEYEKILERVRQTKESVIRMQDQVSPSCPTTKHSRVRGRSSASLVLFLLCRQSVSFVLRFVNSTCITAIRNTARFPLCTPRPVPQQNLAHARAKPRRWAGCFFVGEHGPVYRW